METPTLISFFSFYKQTQPGGLAVDTYYPWNPDYQFPVLCQIILGTFHTDLSNIWNSLQDVSSVCYKTEAMDGSIKSINICKKKKKIKI